MKKFVRQDYSVTPKQVELLKRRDVKIKCGAFSASEIVRNAIDDYLKKHGIKTK